jgi:hypothetical protein
MSFSIRFIAGAVLITPLLAGPFPSDAIAAGDSRFSIWATEAAVVRGPANIAYPEDPATTFGSESDAIGPADATVDEPYSVVSLGDGGSAVLTFATPFGDVSGPDFAVFENGFSAGFLELAHVEVSSDGVNFHRFPSTSLTAVSPNPGEGTPVDPTDVHNLAGKYMAGFGTPFDLAELRPLYPDLDIQRITHVRVIDVIGTNDPALSSFDSAGNIISDPYPTEYPTGGFDLDGVVAFAATTTTYATWVTSQGLTNTSITADGNQNGVPNLVEYLTGNGAVGISGNALHFSRLAYRTGGNLKLEGSDNLLNWTPLAQSINGAAMQTTGTATVSESGDFRKEVTVQLATGDAYRFFRLSAELSHE